jgi:hypothetical protein
LPQGTEERHKKSQDSSSPKFEPRISWKIRSGNHSTSKFCILLLLLLLLFAFGLSSKHENKKKYYHFYYLSHYQETG